MTLILIVQRESSSKMYSSTIFAFTQFLAEQPYSLLCVSPVSFISIPAHRIQATLFFVLLYYLVGLPYESSRAGYVFFMASLPKSKAKTPRG
jgi:hypothetical protein